MAGEIDPKTAEELAENIKLTGKYANDALDAFQKQLKVITQMRDAMSEVAKVMSAFSQQDNKALNPDAWKKVTKEVLKNEKASRDASKAFNEVSTAGAKMAKGLLIGGTVLGGLLQGFKNIVALGKSVIGFFFSVADGIFEVGKSILAIPFKMMAGLFKMASAGGSNELLEALENVRDAFGDLKSESSRAIVDTAKNIETMNESGVPSYLIFGNLAGRIKAVTEMAQGMGAAFQVFQGEVEENGTAMMLYQRGLGITNEQMASLASNAMRMGKGIAQVQNEMTKQALGMSKAFGVNAKVISKDMAKAMGDLAHFGHLSTKEMAIAATFANKLGVSVDKLTGLMDQTATYDQAAEGMSKLNEQYGTNIDATEIMMAQNPADKLQILRKAFAATGKDMSQLTYQDRMFIKQQTGMSDELMNSAFSAKNAGVSLDNMRTQAEKAEKATMSQTEAIKALGDSIKRTFPSGGGIGGGVMDHFLEGFFRGIQTSKEFIGMMMNIKQVLRIATQEGVKFGREFVNLFPGVKEIFTGIKEVFDPKRFKKMFDEVLRTFDVFKTGGSGKIEDFVDRLKAVFKDFTGGTSGEKVKEGFKKFGKAILTIVTKTGEWIWEKAKELYASFTREMEDPGPTTLKVKKFFSDIVGSVSKFLTEKAIPFARDAIKTLTSWISDKEEFKRGIPAASGFAKMLGDIFEPLGQALKFAWQELYPALRDLAIELMFKLKEGLWAGVKAVFHAATWEQIGTAALIQFGPAISSALLGSLTRKLAEKALEKKLVSSVEATMETALTNAGLSPGVTRGAQALAGSTEASLTSKLFPTFSKIGPALVEYFGASLGGSGVFGGLLAGVAAAPLAAGAAAIGGAFFGNYLVGSWRDASVEAGKKMNESSEEFYEKLAKEADPKKAMKLINKEVEEAQRAVKEADKWYNRFGNMLFGTGDEQRAVAARLEQAKKLQQKEADKYIEGTAEYIREQKRIQAEKDKEAEKKQLDALGPVTIQNAAERFKQLDELAKKVMDKGFDIKEKLAAVKAKLDDVTWTIIDTQNEEKLNKAFLQMQKIQGVFANLADVGGLTKLAVDRIGSLDYGKVQVVFKKLQDSIVDAIKVVTTSGTEIGESKMGHYLSLTEVWSPKIAKMFRELSETANSLNDIMKIPTSSASAINDKMLAISYGITQAIMAITQHGSAALDLAATQAPKIKTMIVQASELSAELEKFVKSTTAFSGDVIKTSIMKSLLAVQQMVAATQKMDAALASIDKIDIGARLTQVAGAVGLGGSASKTYTVQSKEVVLHVTFNVSMDAQELEKVMIGNNKSIIRDRINFALDRGAKSDPNTKGALLKPRQAAITGYYGSDIPGSN